MKVLIVTTRYFGDCFLSAALARPIKERSPFSTVDLLTYHGNEKILEGSRNIDHILTIDKKTNLSQFLKRFRSQKNTYDWALITQDSSRAILTGFWLAGHQAMHEPAFDHRSWWKKCVISDFVSTPRGHFLDRQAALLRPILGSVPTINPPAMRLETSLPEDVLHFCQKPYVVCHPYARYRDKNWSSHEWLCLIEKIVEKGIGVILTGGAQKEEVLALQTLVNALSEKNVINLAGRLSFAQTAKVIAQSSLFVGVDTATSHLAAAVGAQCVCLFGPTNVEIWGPSPAQNRLPYDNEHSVQVNGNVIVIRNPKYLTCRQCRSHRCGLNTKNPELGLCMQEISAHLVWSIIEYKKLL